MIKLVLADMDNTLLPVGQEHVSYRAVTAIRELLDLGVRFGPATGRDPFEVDRMFFGARDCYETGILANGKRIYIDGELRRYALLDNGALRQLADLLETVPNAFLTVLAFDNPRGKEPYWSIGARAGDLAWFQQKIGFWGKQRDDVPDFGIIAATIACSGTQAQLDELLAQAKEAVPCFDYVQPTDHWVDILPAGLNEGTALPMLLDELGIGSDEVLFFGGADNDLSIISSVENSVAVANATPAIAAAAKWHIGASADDAVAQALEELAEALRTGETPRFMREGSYVPAEPDEDDGELFEPEQPDEELFAAIRALALTHGTPELGGDTGAAGGALEDAMQL